MFKCNSMLEASVLFGFILIADVYIGLLLWYEYVPLDFGAFFVIVFAGIMTFHYWRELQKHIKNKH